MISGRSRPLPDGGERCFPRVHRLLLQYPKASQTGAISTFVKKKLFLDIL